MDRRRERWWEKRREEWKVHVHVRGDGGSEEGEVWRGERERREESSNRGTCICTLSIRGETPFALHKL